MESHVNVSLVTCAWTISVTITPIFVFWPFVAIVSLIIGIFLSRATTNTSFRFAIQSVFISMLIVGMCIELMHFTGFTQPEWHYVMLFVSAVHLSALYIGFVLSIFLNKARHRSDEHAT